MAQSEVKVTFEPQGRVARVAPGGTVREAAARAGIVLDYPCGGQGNCGKCRVNLMENAPPPREKELATLSRADLTKGGRLACQCTIDQETMVEIPESSLLASTYKILAGSGDSEGAVTDPPVRKLYVELPKPTLEDDAPDLRRLEKQCGSFQIDLEVVQGLPRRLREQDFRGTAVLVDGRLIALEPGNTEEQCFAAAFDIGTTTLVGVLVDLRTGTERASTSRMNPQTSYGDDILSRILAARQSPEGLEHLQKAVVGAVNEMLGELTASVGIARHDVYSINFAGNTTMEHLLAGVDPSALGEVPFISTIGGSIRLKAAALGVTIHPQGRAYLFPVIGGFVGGDTVAGILATGLADLTRPTLFIDIGTNGEIVLIHEGRLLAASCAAGPAFEGARISQGMRASLGAIEEVRFDDRVHIKTIGDRAPVGICGSALIDLAGELLRSGIVVPQGMMLSADQISPHLPGTIRERVIQNETGPEFVVVPAGETQTGAPIVLTQRDIRELQLATGAIRAGISILLRNGGVRVEELHRILVAGAFGNYIRCENAQQIGLLPRHFDPDRIQFVGNTSLTGARLAAQSERARELAEDIRRRTEHIDLACDPNFQTEFAEAMFFPDDAAGV